MQRLVTPGKQGEGAAPQRKAPLLLTPPPLTFGETKAGRPKGDSTPAMGSTGPGCRRPQAPSIAAAWSGHTTASCLRWGLSPGGAPHPFPLVKSLLAPEAPAAATGRPSGSQSSGRWRHGASHGEVGGQQGRLPPFPVLDSAWARAPEAEAPAQSGQTTGDTGTRWRSGPGKAPRHGSVSSFQKLIHTETE